MCELLGLSFNQAIKPRISFQALRKRDAKNPDGWGLAFYPDSAVQIYKEPLKASRSTLATFIKNYAKIRGKTFIGHVRHASIGSKNYRNTHPFARELKGKAYTFAHNGTLHNYKSLTLGNNRPLGTTDSEYVLCYLINQIRRRNIQTWRLADFRWIGGTFQNINQLGTFNCLLTDGTLLFCYRDQAGFNGLSYLHQPKASKTVGLLDQDYQITLDTADRRGYIIASKPLTRGNWKALPLGELLVFKNGGIIFSSHSS